MPMELWWALPVAGAWHEMTYVTVLVIWLGSDGTDSSCALFPFEKKKLIKMYYMWLVIELGYYYKILKQKMRKILVWEKNIGLNLNQVLWFPFSLSPLPLLSLSLLHSIPLRPYSLFLSCHFYTRLSLFSLSMTHSLKAFFLFISSTVFHSLAQPSDSYWLIFTLRLCLPFISSFYDSHDSTPYLSLDNPLPYWIHINTL